MQPYRVVVTSDYFKATATMKWYPEKNSFACSESEPVINFMVGWTATKIKGYCSDRNWNIEVPLNQLQNTG